MAGISTVSKQSFQRIADISTQSGVVLCGYSLIRVITLVYCCCYNTAGLGYTGKKAKELVYSGVHDWNHV